MIDFDGRKIPTELSEIVESAHTVLLVWDMQNDQAGGSFNKEALKRMERFADIVESKELIEIWHASTGSA